MRRLCWSATPIFGYSAWFFSELLSAAILTGAALILFRRPGTPSTITAAAVAGLGLGFAVWVRPTSVLAIPIFAAVLLVRNGKPSLRATLAIRAASAIGVATLLFRDARLSGSSFEFGHGTAAGGVRIENSFDTPLATGLYGLLLPRKSEFLFAPPLLAVAGLCRLWKEEGGAAALAILFLLMFASLGTSVTGIARSIRSA